jgi:hypothetical protein
MARPTRRAKQPILIAVLGNDLRPLIILKPAGRVGSRVPPVEQRVEVYFAGADKPA